MSLEPYAPAPYTTAVSAIVAMDAFRDRGLGVPVTMEVLTRAGVQESISSRTLSSLKLLSLIDKDGKPTQQWEDMRLARGDEEYRARLQEWLRSTYAEILQYADPSTSTLDRITEAFRTYEPQGQRKSMASLLIGLWKYAGLPVLEGDANTARSAARQPRPTAKGRTVKASGKSSAASSATGSLSVTPGLPPGLVGLLQQIPTGGKGWTEETRDNFVRAFTAVLDFTVPVVAVPEGWETEDEPADAEDTG